MNTEWVEKRTLREALAEIIKEECIDEWMQKPNPAFVGKSGTATSPNQLIEEGNAEPIWQMIYQIEHGIFS